MNLHEYQAKALLRKYHLAVPEGFVAHSHEEVLGIYETHFKNGPDQAIMVKAQVQAGGRGQAGGIKRVQNRTELEVASTLLHSRLKTAQTGPQGQWVNALLLEEPCRIQRELYLSLVLDRSSNKIVLMASVEGGMDIETVAHTWPEKIFKIYVEPSIGVQPFQGRALGYQLGLTGAAWKEFSQWVQNLYLLFIQNDLSLIEINPLVVTPENHLLCLDAKINVDENALFRQPELADLRDSTQEDEKEIKAKAWALNYIALEGNIGCMVNGAGLAMATMDMIKIQGGTPANFLDVGGAANLERVIMAFKIILSDEKVKGILVNIFGGIVRCDLIAEGIVEAVKQVGIKVPVVVRLEGNQALEAQAKLRESGLNIQAATSLKEAAEMIVATVKLGKGGSAWAF